MTVPDVTLTQLDGALGIVPPSVGDTQVVIGTSSAGTANVPVAFARQQDVISAFGYGPLVECACYQIAKTGKAVICLKSSTTTSATYGTVTKGNTSGAAFGGACVPTMDATVVPYDEYEPYIVFVTAGTVGVTGITYQYSLDKGRTLSAVQSLGTATSITISEGSCKFLLTSATVTAGDYAYCRTTPPMEVASDFTSAHTALSACQLQWDFINYANYLTPTEIAAVDTYLASQWTSHKHKKAICNVVGPTTSQTEATYLVAQTAALAAYSSTYVNVCGGYCLTSSAVGGQQLRRPVSWVVAARAASSPITSPGVNLADVSLGPLPTDVQLRDKNGNTIEHDEAVYPGLDGIRLTVLRTFPTLTGTYINLARCFAPVGSDYTWWHHRGVINRAADALYGFLVRRLNHAVRVSSRTGYILEADALDIESGANAALRTAVLTVPDASAATFVLSRTDNLIANGTLHGDMRLIPLAYPTTMAIVVGFNNPASRLIAA